MKNKRLLLPVATAAFTILLAGCGGGSGGTSPTPTPTPTATPTPTPTAPSSITFNEVLKLGSSQCSSGVDASCPAGVYFVQESADLNTINVDLQTQVQQYAQWSNNHYAILAAPGNYTLADGAFNLGYYTQVLGAGNNMNDVTINPGVEAYNQSGSLYPSGRCIAGDPSTPKACLHVGGLNNFWRGMENFSVYKPSGISIIAVSQASPIRSINFTNASVLLCDYNTESSGCGYTSGGFMANSKAVAAIIPGSQQQWLSRNTVYGPPGSSTQTAVWNSVYVGDTFESQPTAVAASCTTVDPTNPNGVQCRMPDNNIWQDYDISIIDTTAIRKEKPYLSCGNTCNLTPTTGLSWNVMNPQVEENSQGLDVESPTAINVNTHFFVVAPVLGSTSASGVTTLDTTVISNINTALSQGKGLLITPGVYNLMGTINVTQNNTVILGIGLPDLVCANGDVCMNVSATEGVDISGVTFDAGYLLTSNLLQLGSPSTSGSSGSSANPIFLHDVFFRIAETQESTPHNPPRQTTTALTIYSNHVIGDNLWIWRADHDKSTATSNTEPALNQTNWTEDLAQYGLIVYGNYVTMNGLAVEHFQDYQTVWYGTHGSVNFYQSEMPYDVPSLSDWQCADPKTGTAGASDAGCASYVVDPVAASTHTAYGLGVYTYFPRSVVMARSGFIIPDTAHVNHMIGVFLNGESGSGYSNLVANTIGSTGVQCLGYGVTSHTSIESHISTESNTKSLLGSTFGANFSGCVTTP